MEHTNLHLSLTLELLYSVGRMLNSLQNQRLGIFI